MELGLAGRPAAVAAGSRGLGLACATALAREGARVAICARDGAGVEAARAGIAGATGADVVGIVADVGTAEGATGFVRDAAAALGGCQVLVANAGGPPPGGSLDFSDEEYLAAIESNFLSAVRMAREALPHMRAAGYGRIVAILGSSVKEPIPGLALSNAVRLAAVGFLKTLAREVAPEGITVNAVLPGRLLTDRARQLAAAQSGSEEEGIAAQAAGVPMGRLGDPRELGDVVAFLAGERASYLTGVMLSVDGGMFSGVF
ncbi:MAG: SDR family oxidoreductase [Actinomycetota bacterium]